MKEIEAKIVSPDATLKFEDALLTSRCNGQTKMQTEVDELQAKAAARKAAREAEAEELADISMDDITSTAVEPEMIVTATES